MKSKEMHVGQILPVKLYNQLMENKWREDYRFASESNSSFRPQLAFYLFFDTKGNKRQKGYVLIYQEGSLCRKTKRECLIEKEAKGL